MTRSYVQSGLAQAAETLFSEHLDAHTAMEKRAALAQIGASVLKQLRKPSEQTESTGRLTRKRQQGDRHG